MQIRETFTSFQSVSYNNGLLYYMVYNLCNSIDNQRNNWHLFVLAKKRENETKSGEK